jgi:hypothetical protein
MRMPQQCPSARKACESMAGPFMSTIYVFGRDRCGYEHYPAGVAARVSVEEGAA